MLSDNIKIYLSQLKQSDAGFELYKEEKEYAEKNGLLPEEEIIEKDSPSRFSTIYLERCDKESENVVSTESADLLQQPLSFLKKHKNEFLYAESKWFELVNVEAISLEMDDAFGTYDVMAGLKYQKKASRLLREKLKQLLGGNDDHFELMFSSEEGIWNVNFDLNYVEGYHEEISLGEACHLIYNLLFMLAEYVEGE